MTPLKKHYDKQIAKISDIVMSFPWENEVAYVNWLAQTYHFANATTRLLCLVAARLNYDQQSLHHRFIDHAKEERSHEILLTRDLSFFGKKIGDLPSYGVTDAFYQCQYYWVEHVNPLSFFGYIILLEGLGGLCGRGIYDRIVRQHGEKAGVFVKVHAVEDEDHIAKAFENLATVSAETEAHIIRNFDISTALYLLMLQNAKANGSLEFKAA